MKRSLARGGRKRMTLPKLEWRVVLTVVASCALLGLFMLGVSRAAISAVTAEAESGSLAGRSSRVTGAAGASGDSYVLFGNTPQQNIADIDNAVRSFMNEYDIPGVSIAVTKHENLVYAKSYGTMSPSDSTPVTNGSLYRIASLSKPLTSAGVMKLLEANKLTLDSKIFGPGAILANEYPSAPSATHDITLRNLLQHTTGVWGNDGNDPMFRQLTYSHSQLIKWTLDNYPASTGRGTYAYSNFGYCVLGRVIEKLSGKSYEQYMKDTVLGPAGITGMRIAGNTLADRKPNEVLYTSQNSADPYGMNVARMDSHGGWLATATDLARFLVHVDGFTRKADILQPSTITTMTTPSAAKANYASGWNVNAANNWWHTGSLPGTATEFVRAATGFNWVILCNSRSTAANFGSDLDDLLWPAVNNPNTPWQNIDQF